MSGTFGDVGYNAETNGFNFLSTAQVWGGWAHNAEAGTDMYPFTFTEAGKVTFKASAPNGDVVVKFKFERLPYPDTTPEFFTETVTVTGAEEATYEVAVPAQGTNTFSSFLMYFETQDVEIYMTDFYVTADAKDDTGGTTDPSGGGTMVMNEAFGNAGAIIVAHDNTRVRMTEEQLRQIFNTSYPPRPEDALPIVTFDDEMTFHWNGETIRAFHVDPAHTDGDVILYFENADVFHMGDVFFNTFYPFIDVDSGGSIDGMINFCEQTLNISTEDTIVIPGHGPVTNTATLGRYITMLKTVRDRVALMIAEGKSMEEVVSAKPTADFDKDFGPESASLGFVNRVYTSLNLESL